ncbi:MAG: twin-arginine translocation signal domain-containing protein, partial [Pseudomonadota bacterium]
MKTELYNYIRAAQKMNRRQMLKGTAALGAAAMLPAGKAAAAAHGNVRAEILKIPGVGAGSPTDSDWQKVGEMCLGATKENVAEGEFEGVELTFMGLNNQNLHNFLFRGFLKPWEAYTGAKINWIDLAQADYNARLQQSIATGTV